MAGLNALPADILLIVFDWINWDEIDFTLLGVSSRTRSVLLNHPVVQTLAPFAIFGLKSGTGLMLHGLFLRDPVHVELPSFCATSHLSIEEINKKPWCTPHFIDRVQYALIRKTIKVHWASVLQRDGRLETSGAVHQMLDYVSARCWSGGSGFAVLHDTSEGPANSLCKFMPGSGEIQIHDGASDCRKSFIFNLRLYYFGGLGQAISDLALQG